MSEVKTNKITSLASNNDITLDPDGTGDVLVASGHKLGVGTTSPSNTVDIEGSGTGLNINSTNDEVKKIAFENSGTTTGYIGSSSASPLRFLNGSATEHMRITSGGIVLMGKTSSDGGATAGLEFEPPGFLTVAQDGNIPFILNRFNSDGTLAQLRQDGTTEGSITVSGTTVSFNGGHISRWSRLLDGSKPTTLLKGTVMSNLDDMIVWTGEDNEQLNHTKVSDTEGDVNAAGVFVSWDNDDEDYNDFFLAMTGDMVIRIAKDTTVARGDLLMSAGDGTAKPQGDDIVRSKTIAKVTSTTKSHTYDDGSYLVPCVLMAC